jgi:hypothetical protein
MNGNHWTDGWTETTDAYLALEEGDELIANQVAMKANTVTRNTAI